MPGHCGKGVPGQGRLPDAERIFKELVEARSRVLGEDRPQTWDAMVELTRLYLRQDKLADAEQIFHQAQAAVTKGTLDSPNQAMASLSELGRIRAGWTHRGSGGGLPCGRGGLPEAHGEGTGSPRPPEHAWPGFSQPAP